MVVAETIGDSVVCKSIAVVFKSVPPFKAVASLVNVSSPNALEVYVLVSKLIPDPLGGVIEVVLKGTVSKETSVVAVPFFKVSDCLSNCSCANSLEVYFLVSNSNTVDGVVSKSVGIVTKLLPPVKEEVTLVVSVATVVGVYSLRVKVIPESLGTFIEVGVKGTDCKLTSVPDANPVVAVRVCGVNSLEVYDLVPVA